VADELENAEELENKDMNKVLSAWRASADQQAERPEWFWTRQRSRIGSRLHGSQTRRFPVFAWAGLAATVTLGAALLIPGHNAKPIAPPVPDRTVAEVSDHELMLSLEDTMNNGVPDSLAPASTLADEMEQAYRGRNKGKENRQ
jgi:hypothetical protein